MKLEQAARQALEALEDISDHTLIGSGVAHKAITALREALDPELQFVRDWNEGNVRRVSDGKVMGVAEQTEQGYPTGEVIGACICGSWPGGSCLKCPRIDAKQSKQEPFKRFTSDDVKVAFENGYAAAMSVADIAKEAEQEPVAWWFQPPNKNVRPMFDTQQHGGKWQPLYAAPVRTKDLTDEELWEAAKTAKSNDLTDAFRAVIAADREKNK